MKRVDRGRVIRPRTGLCGNCGEPIYLHHVTYTDWGGKQVSYYVYCHESTGSIDTRECSSAIHPLDPKPEWSR